MMSIKAKINLIARLANEHVAAGIVCGEAISVEDAVVIAQGVYAAAENAVRADVAPITESVLGDI